MKVPYGKQTITDDDINAVIAVLKSDFLTQGPTVKKFEDAFANYVGAKYAVSFCNATAALHSGFKILNRDISKKVLVTANTFAASSNCVLYENGLVEFVDIDPKTFNIDIEKLEQIIEKNPTLYQGIIPVDFAGLPVDMEKLNTIAKRFNLWIMEDACHAVGGGFYDSKKQFIKCGSSIYSDLTVFSFHPVKHIATGEGGMITTNNFDQYQHLLKIRSHGIERDTKKFHLKEDGGWYHEMQELGYNYRMSDLNAALGLSQLKTIEQNIKRRNEIAGIYKDFFKNSAIYFQTYDEAKFLNAYHLFVIQVDKRKDLYNFLKEVEIYSQVHYLPVYKHPYYQNNGHRDVRLENVENYYVKALSLPMFHGMTVENQQYVLEKIKLSGHFQII